MQALSAAQDQSLFFEAVLNQIAIKLFFFRNNAENRGEPKRINGELNIGGILRSAYIYRKRIENSLMEV